MTVEFFKDFQDEKVILIVNIDKRSRVYEWFPKNLKMSRNITDYECGNKRINFVMVISSV